MKSVTLENSFLSKNKNAKTVNLDVMNVMKEGVLNSRKDSLSI